jgi:hypothetical protein
LLDGLLYRRGNRARVGAVGLDDQDRAPAGADLRLTLFTDDPA